MKSGAALGIHGVSVCVPKMNRSRSLILLVLVHVIAGLFALPGYGESVDELSQNLYAERTIQSVTSRLETGVWPACFLEEAAKQGSHGPAFITGVMLLRRLFLPHGNHLENLAFNHFFYFVTFLGGAISLFFLARRWVSETAATGTALLFSTQPLLVGHAFMNPKDVVFMSVLIASAALGMWMVDRAETSFQIGPLTFVRGTRTFFTQFLHVEVWLAGFFLGLSSAIRIAAPLVGVLVLAYIFCSRRWQALPRFVAYGLISLCFMILFWPYLWPDPLGRLIASFLHSAHYPDTHLTLFKGVLYNSPDIPFTYLPTLLTVQLTETTLLLIVAGAFVFLKKFRWDLCSLTLIWFVIPLSAILLLCVNLYNNFRQVFFLLPPLFLLAGLGLDWLVSFLRRPASRLVFLCLILLPGLYANVTLYPYQYVYYNQLAGGLRGAYRVFELDYWHLAFKEGQSFINQAAGLNANIFVGDSKPSAQTFARPDLNFNAFGARKQNWEKYDYIIVSTAENEDQKFAEFPTVFTVERFGVPLVYVKQAH